MALSAIPPIATPPPMSYDVETELYESKEVEQKQRLWDWLRKLRREQQTTPSNETQKPDTPPSSATTRPGLGRRFSKKVGVGIPRSTTFKRQQDEQRQNLELATSPPNERRELSRIRSRALSSSPTPPKKVRKETSAPDLGYHCDAFSTIDSRIQREDFASFGVEDPDQIPPPPPPPPARRRTVDEDDDAASQRTDETSKTLEEQIRLELEQKWILNLSMHFRDKSPREKFFVTFAETPQKWRRVTVSCDYRNAEVDSLEADLRSMNSQREKSARVYESLRASLGDIQFYNTVTNLKLETRDERLHVHVTEDVNEIIAYPPTRCVNHVQHVRKFKESELHFIEHMSGFVYKVNVAGNVWIKKEIPGPDSVDEFLYEVNALSSLTTASHVIELKGLVISDDESTVKGLLIAYAEKNALIDIIYDNRENLPWARRERWARQIIKGLSEIHEAGFVQGDFTLSNIVINGNDEAQIIDINRRGCPVGWEPPEIAKLLESGQRITMFIGLKSDLFQLGMVLWGLAMEEDEPERQARPLTLDNAPEEIPGYFRSLVASCLNPDPVMRKSAREMLKEFPASVMVSNEDLDLMPELRPAPQIPTAPVITGSSSRAYAKLAETDRKREVNEREKITTPAPRRPNDPSDDKGPKYTDMLAATAESTEREYINGKTASSGMLGAPATADADSSMEPQATSNARSRDDSTIDGDKKSNDVQKNVTKSSKESPARGPRKDSVHSSTNHEDDFQDANEEMVPLTPTGSAPWENITGTNGREPYYIPSSILESITPATEQPPPITSAPEHRRRSEYRFQRGISHIDSGLADTGEDTTVHAQPALPASRREQAVLAAANAAADAKAGNGKHATFRNSAEIKQAIEHTDSGLGDMNLVGIGEGMSFKERAHRSGIADDLAQMGLGELVDAANADEAKAEAKEMSSMKDRKMKGVV